MQRLFRIFAVTETSLIICQGAWSTFGGILPLGGSELAQLGVVFGTAFIINEIADCARPLRRRHRGQRCRVAPEATKPLPAAVRFKLVAPDAARPPVVLPERTPTNSTGHAD